jgi:hypothetical protein
VLPCRQREGGHPSSLISAYRVEIQDHWSLRASLEKRS